MVSYFNLIVAAIVMAIASPQECDALVPKVQQSVKDISTFLEHLERPLQEQEFSLTELQLQTTLRPLKRPESLRLAR